MTFPKSQKRVKGTDRLFKSLADFFYFRLKTRFYRQVEVGNCSVILSLGISALMLDIIASKASFSCLSCLILELLDLSFVRVCPKRIHAEHECETW